MPEFLMARLPATYGFRAVQVGGHSNSASPNLPCAPRFLFRKWFYGTLSCAYVPAAHRRCAPVISCANPTDSCPRDMGRKGLYAEHIQARRAQDSAGIIQFHQPTTHFSRHISQFRRFTKSINSYRKQIVHHHKIQGTISIKSLSAQIKLTFYQRRKDFRIFALTGLILSINQLKNKIPRHL